MLERRRTAQSRDTTNRGEASSSLASSSAQTAWTPEHIQTQSFWDGQSAQYVAPSALHQGSPPHAQESHIASYSPEQILSGAHLGGSPSNSRDPAAFQYTSSLGTTLSHPSSVATSPNPHAYYHSEVYSPRPGASEPPELGIPSSDTRPGPYGPTDYVYIEHDGSTASEGYGHERSHPTTSGVSSVNEVTRNASSADLPIGTHPVIISDSPASPSQASSPSLPGSPRSNSDNEVVDFSSPPEPSDTSVNPRSYYRTDAEKALRTPPARKPRDSVVPARLSSLLPATAE